MLATYYPAQEHRGMVQRRIFSLGGWGVTLAVLVLDSHSVLVLLHVGQPAAVQPVDCASRLQRAAVADEGKLPVDAATAGQHLGVPHHLHHRAEEGGETHTQKQWEVSSIA